MPEYKNILLIQLGDIGDVVLTSPSIRAVKETCPEAQVSVLVSKPYGCLLSADPNLHDVVEVSRNRGSLFVRLREHLVLARKLRQARFDLVINLRTGDRGAILSFLTRAKTRIGRPGTKNQFWHKFAYTNTLQNLEAAPPPAHPGADQSLRILRKIGIVSSDTLPRLFISQQSLIAAENLLRTNGLEPKGKWITINPFSRWKYKEWDNTKWGGVIDQIWEMHRMPAVLIGAPEEAIGCQEIVSDRKGHTINIAGKTTLDELAAVISMSSLHLGVDSAAPHIAAALGTPTVTIHGPTDWKAWRVVDAHHRIVSATMDCIPCSKVGCNGSAQSRCLEDLGVLPVVCAANDVLSTSQAQISTIA